MPNKENIISIAIIGTFFSWRGYYKAPCEELSDLFEKKGINTLRSSNRINKLHRIIDMIQLVIVNRNIIDFTVIDVFSGKAFIWAELIAYSMRLIGKPYVGILHGGNLPRFSERNPRRVEEFLQNAAKVVSPSRYLADRFKVIRNDIAFIANPFQIDKYYYRLRVAPKPNIVWVRAFHEIYNPMIAPRVLKSCVDKGIDAKLTMIGPDKSDGSLSKTKTIARQLNVIDRIQFLGGILKGKIPELLDRFDIFINTTNIDNIPVSVIEAMASGLCIVSTDAGGLPYLLKNYVSGILVPVKNHKAMADSISEILINSTIAKKISKNARKVSVDYDWKNSEYKWDQIIHELTVSK